MLLTGSQEDGDIAVETLHPNSVKCLAASPCGRWIASGSYGGTVALFDRASMRFESRHRISKAGVSSLCWSAREGGFLAADYTGAVHVVPTPPSSILPPDVEAKQLN